MTPESQTLPGGDPVAIIPVPASVERHRGYRAIIRPLPDPAVIDRTRTMPKPRLGVFPVHDGLDGPTQESALDRALAWIRLEVAGTDLSKVEVELWEMVERKVEVVL